MIGRVIDFGAQSDFLLALLPETVLALTAIAVLLGDVIQRVQNILRGDAEHFTCLVYRLLARQVRMPVSDGLLHDEDERIASLCDGSWWAVSNSAASALAFPLR